MWSIDQGYGVVYLTATRDAWEQITSGHKVVGGGLSMYLLGCAPEGEMNQRFSSQAALTWTSNVRSPI
jgi:hypothetical protein